VKAFVTYLEAKGHEQGSLLAKARYAAFNERGTPLEDIARQEVAMGFGLLSNTIPSSFWFLFDLYSRPEILAKVREEIRENALHINEDSKIATIDLADVRDQCPFFISTFQESLRFHSRGAPTRFVFEDVLLDGKYLLKKGSTLHMPALAMHSHPASWGSTSTEFNPTRYLKSNPRKAGGFLAFGLSPSVCPGRHFASSEILIFTASLILRFDFTPASSSSSWIAPPLSLALAASTTPPSTPFFAKAAPRDEYKGYEWDFRVTRGKAQFGLVIG
jgi:cytochrome P450